MVEYRQPSLTVDMIIETTEGIVLIERKNEPHGWALPGGFVDYGETLEDAAVRESLEETGLTVKLARQFHAYSNPDRDPRHHTVSVVFIGTAEGTPTGGDDARTAKSFPLTAIPDLVFDHARIIDDYARGRY